VRLGHVGNSGEASCQLLSAFHVYMLKVSMSNTWESRENFDCAERKLWKEKGEGSEIFSLLLLLYIPCIGKDGYSRQVNGNKSEMHWKYNESVGLHGLARPLEMHWERMRIKKNWWWLCFWGGVGREDDDNMLLVSGRWEKPACFFLYCEASLNF